MFFDEIQLVLNFMLELPPRLFRYVVKVNGGDDLVAGHRYPFRVDDLDVHQNGKGQRPFLQRK